MAEEPLEVSTNGDKEVRKALKRILKSPNWRLVKGGHWGVLMCSHGCCAISIGGTTRVPEYVVEQLNQQVKKCPRPANDPRNKKRS